MPPFPIPGCFKQVRRHRVSKSRRKKEDHTASGTPGVLRNWEMCAARGKHSGERERETLKTQCALVGGGWLSLLPLAVQKKRSW